MNKFIYLYSKYLNEKNFPSSIVKLPSDLIATFLLMFQRSHVLCRPVEMRVYAREVSGAFVFHAVL